MSDEPTLPRLVGDSTINYNDYSSRKRVRLSSPPVISSDPVIFSSDDDPSAENYTRERSKKKFRGPWFRQVPASDTFLSHTDETEHARKGKRRLERHFDSGVFLGSDGTDIDEALESMEATQSRNVSESQLPLRQSRIVQTKSQPSVVELANQQIQRCLEDGDETIDLSSRGLSTLSNATIRPLSAFTLVPPVTEGVFEQLEPKLKIFLASNNLTTLPEGLFHLDRLTALSLRGNELQELPSHIGNLQNLRELNVSLNALRFLPFEILDLLSDTARIQTLQLHPNPFFQPEFPITTDLQAEKETTKPRYRIGLGHLMHEQRRRGAICRVLPDQDRSWHSRWKATFQARSDIRYYNNYGTLIKGPRFPILGEDGPHTATNTIPIADISVAPEPPGPRGTVISRAPSLLEVVLKASAQSPQLPILTSLLPEYCPPSVVELLDKATAQKETGNGKCTICSRKFVSQRTEWIEWWELAKASEKKGGVSAASPLRQVENERDVLENLVPLIRRGCSWLCVPAKATVLEHTVMEVDT